MCFFPVFIRLWHFLIFYKIIKGPRWQSGNTLASHLWGRGSIPVMAWSGKAGSCLPLVGSLQYRTLANSMYWFPLPFQLPVMIWPVQCWKRRKTPNKQNIRLSMQMFCLCILFFLSVQHTYIFLGMIFKCELWQDLCYLEIIFCRWTFTNCHVTWWAPVSSLKLSRKWPH